MVVMTRRGDLLVALPQTNIYALLTRQIIYQRAASLNHAVDIAVGRAFARHRCRA